MKENNNGNDTNVGSIGNSIEEDIKIALDKFSDNKDSNSAVLIVEQFILGNYVLVGGRKDIVKNSLRYILSDYKRALKENEKIKNENSKLKVIRYCAGYKTENVHLIPKNDLVEINMNKYMIEVEDGKFVDVKQIYKENETLKKLHIQDNVHLEFIMKNSILVQTIKNKIEKEIKYHEKNILDIENMTMLKSKKAKEEAEIEFNKYAIVVLNKMLQELIEERK